MIHTIDTLYDASVQTRLTDGRWVLAPSLPYFGNVLRAAWAVLTGKAVALRYPVAGELEAMLEKGRIGGQSGADGRQLGLAREAVEDILEIDEDGKVHARGPHSAIHLTELRR